MQDIYSITPLDAIAGPFVDSYANELAAALPWVLVAAVIAVTVCILVTLRRK